MRGERKRLKSISYSNCNIGENTHTHTHTFVYLRRSESDRSRSLITRRAGAIAPLNSECLARTRVLILTGSLISVTQKSQHWVPHMIRKDIINAELTFHPFGAVLFPPSHATLTIRFERRNDGVGQHVFLKNSTEPVKP